MASSDNNKFGHALLNVYVNLYSDKYGKVPTINKYREKWAMADVADSVGYERAKELLEYYFSISKVGHPLQWFFYNFDRLDQALNDKISDEARREKIRKQTKAMVEEAEHNEH